MRSVIPSGARDLLCCLHKKQILRLRRDHPIKPKVGLVGTLALRLRMTLSLNSRARKAKLLYVAANMLG